ncbi:MAG: dicarboxylate/amino acid:cation symporter [bacterium]
MKRKLIPSNKLMLAAVMLGIASGLADISYVYVLASGISNVFMNLLELISLPIIFLSIVSTISSIENIDEMKILGRKVIKYTLFTTIVACLIAIGMFALINPSGTPLNFATDLNKTGNISSVLAFLSQIIPSNIVQAFSNNSNVLSVVFIALLLGFAIITLPDDKQKSLSELFSNLFEAILRITNFIVYAMPIGIWAFVTIFTKDLKTNISILNELFLFTSAVLITNLIQGGVVLPLMLKFKKLKPIKMFKAMYPAIMFGGISRSTSGALPITLKCAETKLGISSKVANFSLPICATINMNGCAVFMITTIMFMATNHGLSLSIYDLMLWVVIATLGAIGNASVPMSCYFLTSAFVASMNIPLHILGIILPIYSLIDMVATALNVWSDSTITAIIDQEIKQSGQLEETSK